MLTKQKGSYAEDGTSSMKLTINSFHNQAKAATTELEKHLASSSVAMERLSSGKRVNAAADDAAAISIAGRLEASTRALKQATENAQDFANLLSVGEGALAEAASVIQRLREIAVAASNETYSDADRQAFQNEASSLTEHLLSQLSSTTWGGMPLFDGTFSDRKAFIGDSSNTENQISITLNGLDRALEALQGTDQTASSSIFDATGTTPVVQTTLSDTSPSSYKAATTLSNGNLRVTWTSVPATGGNGSLYVRDFDSSGNPVSPSVLIDSRGETGGNRIEILGDGTTAIVYSRYNFSTARRDSELVVFDDQLNVTHQSTINPQGTGKDFIDNRIIPLSDGGFLHTWSESNNHPQLPPYGSFAQKFDAGFQKVGSIFSLSDQGTRIQYTGAVELSSPKIGSLVLDRSTAGFSLSFEVFDSTSSTKQSSLSLASSATDSVLNPQTIMLNGAPFAAWIESSGGDLYIAKLSSDGASLVDKKLLATGVKEAPQITSYRKSDGSEELLILAGYSDPAQGIEAFSINSSLESDSFRHSTPLNPAYETNLNFAQISENQLNILFDDAFASEIDFLAFDVETEVQSLSAAYLLSSASNARDSISVADNALEILNAERGMIGAIQNRLSTIISLHQNSVANLEQSKSLLVDADFAKETSELARAQVLQTSASAMISQANGLANEIIEVVNSATGRS